MNAQFLKHTGYTESNVLHNRMTMLTDSELFKGGPEPFIPALAGSLLQANQDTTSFRIRKADGSSMCTAAKPMIAQTEQGLRCVLFLYNQDQAQDGNLIERFGETMLRDQHIGVILLHAESLHILEISPLACQLLGVTKSSVVNEPLSAFFADSMNEYKLICNALLSGEHVRNYPMTWRHGEKQTELLMDVGLLHSDRFVKEGAYIIFKDVTNLRSLETQVQRSDRLAMIGQIAAGAAHEIRNPLTAIRGFLQMFRKTMDENGMRKEKGYTEIMLNELDRINHLVGEFLLLSKPKEAVTSWIQVGDVLRGIMPVVSSEALLHNVSIQWDEGLELPRVMADGELLKQVFLNLCKNGIEAMTEGGTLSVRGYADQSTKPPQLFIEIEDTGPGIPPHLVDKIFDPFVTTKQNGTGLGLSVCQRILHDFGGTIKAAAREKGALFTVVLPC
ncbi:ATP-binding protein [Paenibacillus sp. R14(2021)]|uniref:ATP-binding protein n=1 Tax=Paenibacillus sp. R14(2021) TaxID=2859228 RepID=UPI0021578C43|nr:ATP-binding protein [Paenibacillus sp. R14(2021)]